MPTAQRETSRELLSQLSQFVANAMGLHFPQSRLADLRRGLVATAAELGFEDAPSCAAHLMSASSTKDQFDALAAHLTVGETYFFREPHSFDALTQFILPELIHQRLNHQRHLRIWSAACCTGEEPYSIAMALRQAIPDLDDWNLTLLATDINPRFLRKAEAGIFGAWSFRDTPAWVKEKYFRPLSGGRSQIRPEINKLVRFANLNLVGDSYPSLATDTNAMDIIFCRNVLMYFNTDQAAKVIHKLQQATIDRGWLIVSPSELSQVDSPQYTQVNFPGAILYRKQPRKPKARLPRAVAAPAPTPIQRSIPPKKPSPKNPPEKTPPQPEPYDHQARSLANQGRLHEALACCDRWLSRDRLHPPAHYLRAVILQETGDLDKAIESLRAAIYLDPNFIAAHFSLGSIARQRNELGPADKHLISALRLAKKHQANQPIPETDGITAARFIQMIHALTSEVNQP